MPNPGIDRDRIMPEFMTALSEPLEAVYQCINHDLMVLIAEAFKEGKQYTETTAWRATMLARMGGLTKGAYHVISSYTGDISDAVRYAINGAVIAGIELVEPELAMLIRGGYVPPVADTQRRVMDMYYQQSIEKCNMVNTVMLNSTLHTYEEIVTNVDAIKRKLSYDQQELNAEAGAVISGAKSRTEAVNDALINMSRNGITGFTDRAGRSWEAQAYINMDIRTTAANAAREASFQRNSDYGNNLISVSAHAGARPGCYPYQGKVYSTDGTSGTVEDLHGTTIHYEPLSSTSYGEPGGLFGINCGHFNYPFIPSLSVVRASIEPKEENDARYARNQEQRGYERGIRQLKTQADLMDAAGNSDAAKQFRRRAASANAELQLWCEANGQDYKPDRVRVIRAK